MSEVSLVPLNLKDADSFLKAVHSSTALHAGWVEPPSTMATFEQHLNPHQQVCFGYAIRNRSDDLVEVNSINATHALAADEFCAALVICSRMLTVVQTPAALG